MSDIQEKIALAMKNIDIDATVAAVIADDPDAKQIKASLTSALKQAKSGKYARISKVQVSPIVETRLKTGLSQNKFAETLGISVNTLRSWEQGNRQPSGAAATLLHLLNKRPELVLELRA
ncbi:type II toxin-antitoxin system MqsA family antitoxin [Gallibacterium anatis]|uniref:helix-turn-helix domain-containing protein n=1 Tax=Gallibacterium anatis TaxID=750 RepID=UPI00254B31A0|nr:type II toxin-antitoxin system MqsA family antitoxin [Gallibacterium anatis]WIM84958.1 type II toxin-antitoxin system MqsA family antitoxin [Gallibacterium anatis]